MASPTHFAFQHARCGGKRLQKEELHERTARQIGRRRKPAVIRKAEGKRGHRPIREEPQAHGWPRVPVHLSPDERLIWAHLMKTMPAGVVTGCDEYILEAFVVSVSTYHQADELIRKSALMVRGAEGRPIANPLLRIRSRAFNEMRAGAIELGLTPAARARLVKVDVEEPDPMEMLLGGDGDVMQWGIPRQ